MSIDETQSAPAFGGFATSERDQGTSAGMPPPGSGNSRGSTSFKQEGVALKDKAMDRLSSEADARKEGVSTQLKSVSGALKAAQDDLDKGDGETPQWLKSGLQQVASTVELLADRIQDKSSSELIGEVKTFAKTQPVIFLAACAAAGFAAARVFKAGGAEMATQTGPSSGYNPSQQP